MCSWQDSKIEWHNEDAILEALDEWREKRRREELDFYGPEWWDSYQRAKVVYKWIELDYIFGRA